MADKRADLSGNPEDFEQVSGTAKLERKKVVLGRKEGDDAQEEANDDVRTADLRERMKVTLKRRQTSANKREDEGGNPDDEDTTTADLTPDRPGTERVVKKGTEKVVKRKTIQMGEGDAPAAAAGSNKSDSQRMLRPRALAGMSEEEQIRTQELLPHEMDPSRRRETDTANLKRIRPGKTSAEGVSAAGETGTDTIHLRVIKEKKNQLKNILSASQTIRLRPSPTDTTSTKRQTASAPSTTADTSAEDKKRTLKIKAPSTIQEDAAPPPAEETAPTETVRPSTAPTSRPGTAPIVRTEATPPPETREEPHTAMVNRDKLKQTAVPTQLKRKGESESDRQERTSTDTVKLKSPVKQAGVSPMPPIAPPSESGSKSTLKIKAPAAAPPPSEDRPPSAVSPPSTDTAPVPTAIASDTEKKSTLKIKAPSATDALDKGAATPATQTASLPAPADASAGGKTLKLKAAPKTQTLRAPAAGQQTVKQPAPQAATAAAAEPAPAAAAVAKPTATADADQPGLLYTLGAAASVALIGFVAVRSAMQYFSLF